MQMPDENWRSVMEANRPARVMMLRHAFPPVNLNLLTMLTKELSTVNRVQPSFIEPMQVSLVRELPDDGKWT
jgi:hypothetical protein